jgi:hypothetical protein
MSRRASNAGASISLFSFLSILACLIGILTILISLTSALKTIEGAGRDKDELARATEHAALLARQQRTQQEIAALNA